MKFARACHICAGTERDAAGDGCLIGGISIRHRCISCGQVRVHGQAGCVGRKADTAARDAAGGRIGSRDGGVDHDGFVGQGDTCGSIGVHDPVEGRRAGAVGLAEGGCRDGGGGHIVCADDRQGAEPTTTTDGAGEGNVAGTGIDGQSARRGVPVEGGAEGDIGTVGAGAVDDQVAFKRDGTIEAGRGRCGIVVKPHGGAGDDDGAGGNVEAGDTLKIADVAVEADGRATGRDREGAVGRARIVSIEGAAESEMVVVGAVGVDRDVGAQDDGTIERSSGTTGTGADIHSGAVKIDGRGGDIEIGKSLGRADVGESDGAGASVDNEGPVGGNRVGVDGGGECEIVVSAGRLVGIEGDIGAKGNSAGEERGRLGSIVVVQIHRGGVEGDSGGGDVEVGQFTVGGGANVATEGDSAGSAGIDVQRAVGSGGIVSVDRAGEGNTSTPSVVAIVGGVDCGGPDEGNCPEADRIGRSADGAADAVGCSISIEPTIEEENIGAGIAECNCAGARKGDCVGDGGSGAGEADGVTPGDGGEGSGAEIALEVHGAGGVGVVVMEGQGAEAGGGAGDGGGAVARTQSEVIVAPGYRGHIYDGTGGTASIVGGVEGGGRCQGSRAEIHLLAGSAHGASEVGAGGVGGVARRGETAGKGKHIGIVVAEGDRAGVEEIGVSGDGATGVEGDAVIMSKSSQAECVHRADKGDGTGVAGVIRLEREVERSGSADCAGECNGAGAGDELEALGASRGSAISSAGDGDVATTSSAGIENDAEAVTHDNTVTDGNVLIGSNDVGIQRGGGTGTVQGNRGIARAGDLAVDRNGAARG